MSHPSTTLAVVKTEGNRLQHNTYGVEPFDVGYGAAFNVEESPADIECEIVEGDGTFGIVDPESCGPPDGVAFVDGTMLTEARLTRLEDDGTVTPGLAGSWAAGAVLALGDGPLEVAHTSHGRVAIFCGGDAVDLPAHPAGWSWVGMSVHGDMHDARHRLQRTMRDAEGKLAENLSTNGWLTVVDGPLSNIRKTRTTPVVGYVKTHHRRMLAPDSWARVPELQSGQRTRMFAVNTETFAAYLRVGDSGPWASPWAGIARIEVPALAGQPTAQQTIDQAAAWLPGYASAPHRDPRAPINLTPIAGLEQRLRRLTGNPQLAVRALRHAILQLNNTIAA